MTLLALIAFAANSVLTRLALDQATIDPTSFTLIRLTSGIVVLFTLIFARHLRNIQCSPHSKGSWIGGLMLFSYAAGFSFAYQFLDTATGALILFGSVQITLFVDAKIRGEVFNRRVFVGLVLTITGFIYLFIPDVTTPNFTGACLMLIAGVAWGGYTVIGRASRNPLSDTSYNFLRTIPFLIVLWMFSFADTVLTPNGIVLAILSGGVASGLGYALWYAILPSISSITAGVLQLSVPILAALGGAIFISELPSLRLCVTSILVLSGILLITLNKAKQSG